MGKELEWPKMQLQTASLFYLMNEKINLKQRVPLYFVADYSGEKIANLSAFIKSCSSITSMLRLT